MIWLVEEGNRYYRREQYAKAIECYRKAADKGYPKGWYALAKVYHYGKGVVKDERKVKQLFGLIETSAKAGNSVAQNVLGEMYKNGYGVSQNYQEAFKWYHLAAIQMDAYGQFNLGCMYEDGKGVPQNYQEAGKWYHLAAEQENSFAQLYIGIMYKCDFGVVKDYQEALKWYRFAVAQGYAPAQARLGVMYGNGHGVPRDCEEALKWYRLAAEQKDALAEYKLGLIYFKGTESITKDYREASKWLQLSGSRIAYRTYTPEMCGFAQWCLGSIYYVGGYGILQNYKKAYEWYNRAACNGDDLAYVFLGDMYQKGHGVSQDYQKALEFYRFAAKQGNVEAMQKAKEMEEKIVVQKIEAEGNVEAQFSLGEMLLLNRKERNSEEAYRYLKSAALQGHGIAKCYLGLIHEYGLCGVEPCLFAALFFYENADKHLGLRHLL